MNIEIIRLTETAIVPSYQSEQAGAFDLHVDFKFGNLHCIEPGDHFIIPTGIAIHVNDIYSVGKIYPRSSLAFKHGIVLRNGTGIIDSDYQGEIKICLINNSDSTYLIEQGDRIAQMVIQPIYRANFTEVSKFSNTTTRGIDGFGSSGK